MIKNSDDTLHLYVIPGRNMDKASSPMYIDPILWPINVNEGYVSASTQSRVVRYAKSTLFGLTSTLNLILALAIISSADTVSSPV